MQKSARTGRRLRPGPAFAPRRASRMRRRLPLRAASGAHGAGGGAPGVADCAAGEHRDAPSGRAWVLLSMRRGHAQMRVDAIRLGRSQAGSLGQCRLARWGVQRGRSHDGVGAAQAEAFGPSGRVSETGCLCCPRRSAACIQTGFRRPMGHQRRVVRKLADKVLHWVAVVPGLGAEGMSPRDRTAALRRDGAARRRPLAMTPSPGPSRSDDRPRRPT